MFKLFTSLIILLLTIASLLILEERKTFDVSTLVQINPIPHTKELIKKEEFVEAEEYLTYFIAFDYVKNNPESLKLLKQIQTKRNSPSYRREKVLQGILEGKSDENIGQASAIASDLFVIGDIRDIIIQGMHYQNDEEVDKFILSLSALGLLATATTIYSLGATAPIKGTISLMKYGKRMNKIPLWLETKLIKQVKLAKKTKSLKKIESLFQPVQELFNTIKPNQALYLLSKSRNLSELKSLNKLATRFGTKSPVLLKSTNNTALKYMKEMPNVSKKNFLYASTYGEQGLKGMQKLGASKFIKRVELGSNLAKTTYKGNFNSLFNALLKNIPNMLLYAISLFGLFYFISKFFTLARKLF